MARYSLPRISRRALIATSGGVIASTTASGTSVAAAAPYGAPGRDSQGGESSGPVDPTDMPRASTSDLNRLTGATARFDDSLHRAVPLPDGKLRVGENDSSIFVRKGQTLVGRGLGSTTLDATGAQSNRNPIIALGRREGRAVDDGGQPVQVSSMLVLGGPVAAGVIDTSGVAGWKVDNVFFSASGVGIQLGGGDGLVASCQFDLGLNHIVARQAGNVIASGNIHYLGNYQITISDDCRDISLVGNQHEYFRYAGVYFGDRAENIENVSVTGCNFIQNEQYDTTQGAIYFRCNHASVVVAGCRFRNIKGPAINYGTGVGNRLDVMNCQFDGRRTHRDYNPSTSMGGLNVSNIHTVIRGCSFRNLPGQPIRLGGDEATTWIIDSCDFTGNTGGSTEIEITNTNPQSRVVITNCQGDGRRALVNRQLVVPVFYERNDDGGDATIQSSATILWPYGVQAATILGGKPISRIVADRSTEGRTFVLFFAEDTKVESGTGNIRLDGDITRMIHRSEVLTLSCLAGVFYQSTGTISAHRP